MSTKPTLIPTTHSAGKTGSSAEPSPTARSKPIAIPRPTSKSGRGYAGETGASVAGALSQSLPPRAPVIGSLPTPPMMRGMPDIALPAISPQAVSLLAASEPRSRVVGVSSAPAKCFMDQAKQFAQSAPVSASPTILFTLMEERLGPVDADDDDETSVPLGGSRATTKSRGTSLISEFEAMRVGSMGAVSTASGDDAPSSGGHRHPHRHRAPSDGSEDDSDSDTSSDEDESELPFQLDP